jgi:hypothetical protein
LVSGCRNPLAVRRHHCFPLQERSLRFVYEEPPDNLWLDNRVLRI